MKKIKTTGKWKLKLNEMSVIVDNFFPAHVRLEIKSFVFECNMWSLIIGNSALFL